MGEEVTIALNRKARHEFSIDDTFEAGIVLTGSEIKSIRAHKVNLADAYARVERGEAWLIGAHIAPFEQANRNNHEPKRQRKLLLHRRQIDELLGRAKAKGQTIVPLRLYLNSKGARRSSSASRAASSSTTAAATSQSATPGATSSASWPTPSAAAEPATPCRPRRAGSWRDRPPRGSIFNVRRTDVRSWGCVDSTGLGRRGTRAEVPSGLVKQAAKRSTWQPPVDSRPRRVSGRRVSVEAISSPRMVEASCSGDASRISVA